MPSSNCSSSSDSNSLSSFGPQTPQTPNDNRTSLLRASVFDAFAELGTFDENSRIAEWIFNPDVDVSKDLQVMAPRRENVRFLEKSGSRFRERLSSDASVHLLNMGMKMKEAPVVATRRPTKRFFGGLRSRSASRRREKQDEAEMKKKPFLPFTRTKPYISPPIPISTSLEIPRSPYALGHSSNASVATASSWINIHPSPSLDLLRNPESSSNTFLGAGVPFPRERAISVSGNGGSPLFKKISSIVRPPGSAAEAALLPVRRTQSRPAEVTEATHARLSGLSPSFATPVHRQHATLNPDSLR